MRLRRKVVSAAVLALAAGCSVKNSEEADQGPTPVIYRNTASFLFASANSDGTKVTKFFQFLWSPSCRDTMRFYSYCMKPFISMRDFPTNTVVIFTMCSRTAHDMDVGADMLKFRRVDYIKLAMAHLELGAQLDRYLTPRDTDGLISSLGLMPEVNGLYDRDVAIESMKCVNALAMALNVHQTPGVIYNGNVLPTDQAALVISGIIDSQ